MTPKERASGEHVCEACGKPYYKHFQPTASTVVVGCDGRWLKL